MSGLTKLVNKARNFWLLRSASEKRTLSVAGVLLLTSMVFFGVYEPLRKTHARMVLQTQSQALALKEVSALMAARIARQGLSATGPGANPDAANQSASSLTALVDQSIRGKNMQGGLKNISTVPPNKVRLELGGVNFDVLMTMLEQLERESQVQVLELSIDTLGTSTVNAKVTLAR
jgi:type II secretory pathway component PulM